MRNDGQGVDVEKHPVHGDWIPSMVFGKLRSSTNYRKEERRVVGGKNGVGVKLAIIWSTWAKVTTIDSSRKRKFVQVYKDNLLVTEDAKVTENVKTKPYTELSFTPDYARLGIPGLSDADIAYVHRRVCDIAAVTHKGVKVSFNGADVGARDLPSYINLHVGKPAEAPRVYENPHPRWEYAVCLSPTDESCHVSFVNGIYTDVGGSHVDYIMRQIVRKLTAYIKKRKRDVDVKPAAIREQLMLFLRCDIENPSFESQTKSKLSTAPAAFGSECVVSDKFIDKVAKLGVMDTACAVTEAREARLMKKTDGVKRVSVRGIPKLVDAHDAGTKRSADCRLILCEGDSAKTGVLSGLSKKDRQKTGVYPLKGKLLNVRGETSKKIADNKEIADIKKALGLEAQCDYSQEANRARLRYGSVVIMTDQDLDGSHIKGLTLNLFDSQWKGLLDDGVFTGYMNTPIVKARKGKTCKCFYSDAEYEEWVAGNPGPGWKTKYYKGLGTSTAQEFKEYFEDPRVIPFLSSGVDCADALDKAFNKKRARDRRTWLEAYASADAPDSSAVSVSCCQFVDTELIHFSKHDCERSIPSALDGLKPSQRKIIWVCLKRRLTNEVKVAQLSGSVSELACYHHGEASLQGATVGLAQNFVGSNNINLLEPRGQFGSRIGGGKDSASVRYIFTCLSPITRLIFRPEDDVVLEYNTDDGTQVEPVQYYPVIPMLLVNGSVGIGTGFSTDVPRYNPRDVLEATRAVLMGNEPPHLIPWQRGFTGDIVLDDTGTKFMVSGRFTPSKKKNTVTVSEIPFDVSIDSFKEKLDKLVDTGTLKDYKDNCTPDVVDIEVTFKNDCKGVAKTLGLCRNGSLRNMNAFDETGSLKHFDAPIDVVNAYIGPRLAMYEKRRAKLLEAAALEGRIADNKVRFIQGQLSDEIDLRRKSRAQCADMLRGHNLDELEGSYGYLLRMPADSVTEEKVAELLKEQHSCAERIAALEGATPQGMWLSDLAELEEAMI